MFVDAQGRKCVNADLALDQVYPTATTKPTTFPNGNPFPAGTKVDNWWRFVLPGGAFVACDGSRPWYFPYNGVAGKIMRVMLDKNGPGTWLSKNQNVRMYREFLDESSVSSYDPIEAQSWLNLANGIAQSLGYPANTYSLTDITADITAAHDPKYNQSQG